LDDHSSNNSGNNGRESQKFHVGERSMLEKRVFKRLKHMNFQKLVQRSNQFTTKWINRRRTQHPTKEKLPVFIVGCNRSGTNMVCGAIGKSPHGWDYRESAFSIAFDGYYLRQDWIIEQLIRFTPAPLISFGSILDSQFTNSLISHYEGAKAIWVYRNFKDVANSCARMQWGPTLKELVKWVAKGELDNIGARGKNITPDTVQLFSEIYRDDISVVDGACLYWYMRNQLFFDLKLNENPDVLILQYEDTVLNQEETFQRVFEFLGFPYDPAIIEGIYASSVGKHSPPKIDPAIEEACEPLKVNLDAEYIKSKQYEFQFSEEQFRYESAGRM
jgi:hypothetical protein